MEMTVEPVLPAPAEKASLVAGKAKAAPAKTSVPSNWLKSALSAFIDVLEPAVVWMSPRRRLVVVELENSNLAFYKVSRRRTDLLGMVSAPDEALIKKLKAAKCPDVELRLQCVHVTFANFKIPAAGAELAGQIVESRLDRLTPWRTDAILHGYTKSTKPSLDGQLDINVAATSRPIASASLDRLAAFGLAPSRLGATDQPINQRLGIDLYGGKNDIARHGRRRSIGSMAIMFLVSSVLACGATFYALHQSNERIAELDATLAKARNRLVQASGSTAERDRDLAYIAMKSPEAARFFLIDRLAAILPDNTSLDELTIEPGQIRIAGISIEASNLIKLLEDDPQFFQAKFVAPVTRQEDGRDRFEITASYVTRAREAAP
jgi:general secretion pathway protein L